MINFAIKSQYFKRKMIEVIEIRKHNNNLNKDNGFEMSNTWIPLLTK